MNTRAASPTRFAGTALMLLLLGLALIPMQADAQAQGPYYYYPLTPCRFVDTRDATLQGGSGPLPRFVNVPFTAKGHCGIPFDAKAVSINVTVVSPTGAGFLTMFPTGVARPWISVIDWASTDNALANGAIVPLGSMTSGELSAYHETDGGGTVHLILDATGYFK